MLNFLLAFIPRAIVQGIPLLFGSTGEIVTEKSGNLNLGIPGVMYVGAICGVIGSFFYEHSVPDASAMNGTLAILIPMACCMLGSLLMGILYCFLTVTLRANQNVTGLAMTTFGVGFGNFFGGSISKLAGGVGTGRQRCAVHYPDGNQWILQQDPSLCRKTGLVWKIVPVLRLSGISGSDHCAGSILYSASHPCGPSASCSWREPEYCRCSRY